MPLTQDSEIDEIIAFMNTHKKPDQQMSKMDMAIHYQTLSPESIKVSNLVVGLQLITQIPPSSDSGKLPLARITKLDFQPR